MFAHLSNSHILPKEKEKNSVINDIFLSQNAFWAIGSFCTQKA